MKHLFERLDEATQVLFFTRAARFFDLLPPTVEYPFGDGDVMDAATPTGSLDPIQGVKPGTSDL
ncbi:hypothetical protein [Dyella sp.]|uniref:hypothetical protein n=1 Tax=Dyella sp. TaxID=1869338 RepID=UPI002C7D0E1D|nr:hypothetical protein [Dyella sp.]HTC25572.1 hypothetical protein [Dyella sp.]